MSQKHKYSKIGETSSIQTFKNIFTFNLEDIKLTSSTISEINDFSKNE